MVKIVALINFIKIGKMVKYYSLWFVGLKPIYQEVDRYSTTSIRQNCIGICMYILKYEGWNGM